MMCDCLDKLQNTLHENGYHDAELTNVRVLLGMKEGNGNISLVPEPIRFRYHPENADGKKSKKWERSFVDTNYCPICGTKTKKGK